MSNVEDYAHGGYIPGPGGTVPRLPDEEVIPAAEVREHGRRLLDQLNGESTSSRLRRIEQERDQLLEVVRAKYGEIQLLQAELASARKELESLRHELAHARFERDQRRAFMTDPVSQPHWIVARDGGRECRACRGEITRGEAYELIGLDELRHIHCPADRQEPRG